MSLSFFACAVSPLSLPSLIGFNFLVELEKIPRKSNIATNLSS